MPTCRCKPTRRPPSAKPERRGLLAVLGAIAGLLLLTGGYLWFLGGTAPPRSAGVGGPFTLTAANGQTVTERSFQGRYVLVYFGYTSCQDVCPLTLGAVAHAMDVLGPEANRIQPLFVTVDPQRDTPDVLGRYVAGFSPRLLGLTGTSDQLRRMRQDYRVTSIVHPGSAGSAGYTVDHSSVLYLLGPDGHYLAPIRADETGAEDSARHCPAPLVTWLPRCYARVSTDDQRLDLQLDALSGAGCDRTFQDRASGARTDWPGLNDALSHLRRGNTLVVWRLDRLGRTTHQLVELFERFERGGIRLRSLQDGIDPSSVMGKAMLQIGAVFVEMERNLLRERTKAGLAAARARGRADGSAAGSRPCPPTAWTPHAGSWPIRC